MATEFKVFHGVGAAIAQVTSNTKFSVYAIVNDKDKIDFAATERTFVVDLKATPSTMQTFAESAIRFDDRGLDNKGNEVALDNGQSFPRGRGTTLGSGALEDMMSGTFIGTVYIEHEHFNVIRKTAIDPQPWPPNNSLQLYQITSIAYSLAVGNGARAGRRYHGYCGIVTEVTETDFSVLFQTKLGGPTIGPHKFTLGDATQYDNDPPSLALGTALPIAAPPITKDARGALFVALKYAAQIGLDGGKLPIGLGLG